MRYARSRRGIVRDKSSRDNDVTPWHGADGWSGLNERHYVEGLTLLIPGWYFARDQGRWILYTTKPPGPVDVGEGFFAAMAMNGLTWGNVVYIQTVPYALRAELDTTV